MIAPRQVEQTQSECGDKELTGSATPTTPVLVVLVDRTLRPLVFPSQRRGRPGIVEPLLSAPALCVPAPHERGSPAAFSPWFGHRREFLLCQAKRCLI